MKNKAIVNIADRTGLKALLIRVSLLVCIMFLTATAHAQKYGEKTKRTISRAGTGEVISHREITLKSGIDPVRFEKWVVGYFNPALEGMVPGIRAYVAKADRGSREGKYAYVIHYDSHNTRQAYQPETGQLTEYFNKFFFEPNKYLHDELFAYIEKDSFFQFTDWVVLK